MNHMMCKRKLEMAHRRSAQKRKALDAESHGSAIPAQHGTLIRRIALRHQPKTSAKSEIGAEEEGIGRYSTAIPAQHGA